MNIEVKWEQWVPIDNLAKKYRQGSVLFDEDGFKIIMSNDSLGKSVEVDFYDITDIFRYTEIRQCGNFLRQIDASCGEGFHKEWSFFKVINSEFLNWLVYTSSGILEPTTTHFAFVTSDCIIEVIVGYEPKITFLD